MARYPRRRITWRSRVLIRSNTPFVDNYGVSNNKRKREIEHDERKPGKVETMEEQIMRKRQARHDAFQKSKKGKPDPFGPNKYKPSKGELLAITLSPLGAVVLAAAATAGGEFAAALATIDEMCEVAGAGQVELSDLSNAYKMD